MNKRKKKRIIKSVVIITLIIGVFVAGPILIRAYFDKIDEMTKEYIEETDATYTSKNDNLNSSGLYVSNLKDELSEHVEDTDISTISYILEDENFYLVVEVIRDEEGNTTFNIDKVVDESLNINARINLINVNSIEYRSGERNDNALIKINTEYDREYFAMTNGAYHILGDDIESISYMDDHFYYMSYNPKYEVLADADSCSKEIKNEINGFSNNDYYYRYGRINFLTDYYQKLASKTFTVGDRCEELEVLSESDEKE